jgi:hypothetical protein
MTRNLTRGGLVAAKIVNLATREEVRFMFNPFEYTISKQNSWEKKSVMGQNIPQVVFQQGGAQTLSLTLHFDSLPQGTDVRRFTDPLWKMMMVNEQAENPRSGKSSPPAVAFEWGRLYFKSIITSMSQKFTLFNPDGTPVRCSVDVSLEQIIDENNFQPQVAGQSGGQTAPRSTTVIQGDRMDHIATSSSGSPDNWRSIAETNNIDDPLRIRPGQDLKT